MGVWGTGSDPDNHSVSEQVLSRNVERFREGLVFKAHRWLYHSTLGSRVIKKKKKKRQSLRNCTPTLKKTGQRERVLY